MLTDADGDTIPDGIETLLLARFRPYYRFSSNYGDDEQYPPTSYLAFIQLSRLMQRTFYTPIPLPTDHAAPVPIVVDNVVIDWGLLAANPAQILTFNNGAANLTRFPDKTQYLLQVQSNFYHGYIENDGISAVTRWADIVAQGNLGMHGHVAPDINGNYSVEFWQFYAYNYAAAGGLFDHVGDLEHVKLIIDAQTLKPISVYHSVHGKDVLFEMGEIQPVVAGNVAEYRGENYDTGYIDLYAPYGGIGRAQNNLVRFYAESRPDGTFGDYTHPVVYIEYGTHATWPSEHWVYVGAPSHDGDTHQFLTTAPPNLGEVTKPLSVEASIIMQFNGCWGTYTGPGGDNPPSPCLHNAWQWPPSEAAFRSSIPDSAFQG
jgi:hypothetical protein